MLSFHNDESIKNKYVARVDEHLRLDNLIQGNGWDGHKGCHVGCTLNKYEHKDYETELGLPEWLARLSDTLHEGQTSDDSKIFFKEFLRSIPIGKDLEKIKYQFSSYLMEENLKTLESIKCDYGPVLKVIEGSKKAIIDVKKLHDDAIISGIFDKDAASAAESAAYRAASAAESAAYRAASAADRAAYSAAERAAERAADRAAERAAYSAARAAESAASAAERAAERAAYSAARAADSAARAHKKHSDKLLELLKAI